MKNFDIHHNEIGLIFNNNYFDLLHEYRLISFSYEESTAYLKWEYINVVNVTKKFKFLQLTVAGLDFIEISTYGFKNIYNGIFKKLDNVGFIDEEWKNDQIDYFYTINDSISQKMHLIFCFSDDEIIRLHGEFYELYPLS